MPPPNRARVMWIVGAYIELPLLNSVDYPEFPDRKVGVSRACTTNSTYLAMLCPHQSSH